MNRLLAGLAMLVVVAGPEASVVAADPKLLRNSDIVALTTPEQVARGVTGGALPWVIKRGKAKVDADGDVKVMLKGLVFAPNTPFAGTAGPVTAVYLLT